MYQWPKYDSNIGTELVEFCKGDLFNSWNLGDLYQEVPTQYAEKMGAKFGIFCNSGTSGLHASLLALGLQPGDEVVVPSMTFIRAVTPLVHLGLIPVLADVDQNTGNLDPESLLKVLGPKTKAVIVVHMWGVPAMINELKNICTQKGLYLIEDFSHAHYSELKQGVVGSFGDISFGSLQRKKTISVGEGGLIVTSNSDLYKRLQEITSPGSFHDCKNYSDVDFSGFGLNFRMSPFSAVVAKSLYPKIDSILHDRERNVNAMIKILEQYSEIEIPKLNSEIKKVSWYSLKIKATDELKYKLLNSKGKLWKFSELGYAPIATHVFWSKDYNCFPFTQNIRPLIRCSLKGTEEYLNGRLSVAIPSLDETYWKNSSTEWGSEFVQFVQKEIL